MAASLSRPDPSSPASVAEAAFNTSRRGFQPDEVRAFLVAVAAEMGRLQERERQLEAELRDLRDVEQPELDDETVTKLLGEETLRVLHTARESASHIKIRAEDTAARILREANDEANRLRQDADVEAARRRQDAASDAEAEVALAKQQGREMVNEARAYRERVLADLERRTTLARHQIEELIHGRDRLLQVFERARLVAVDVTSELQAIDSPDELVNLTPTTGPVPIMVPTDRRPSPSADAEPTDAVADEHDTDERQTDAAQVDQDDDDGDGEPNGAATVDHGDDVDRGGSDSGDDSSDDPAPDTTDATDTLDAADAADEQDDDEQDDDDHDEADEHDEADAAERDDDADADADETEAASKPDTNVVSLFRGRAAPADAAAADEHPSTEAESSARPDVGGIFERLREEVPAGQGAPTTDAMPNDRTDAGDANDADEAAPDEPDAFTRRDEVLVPLIVAGARRVKRVLADEQNEALDCLRQGDPVTSLDDLVPIADEHVAVYLAALTEELETAAAAGAGELGVNDTKTLRKRLTKASALGLAESHVRSMLVVPLRDRLERAIGDGDGDNDEITKRVRSVYREWKTQHIDDQLDDVFRSAYNGGLHAELKPDSRLVWTTDPRLTPCPDCEDNSLAGPVAVGDEFPTGHGAAPAHPGCTCMALPAD